MRIVDWKHEGCEVIELILIAFALCVTCIGSSRILLDSPFAHLTASSIYAGTNQKLAFVST
jgi:hypothetical protein